MCYTSKPRTGQWRGCADAGAQLLQWLMRWMGALLPSQRLLPSHTHPETLSAHSPHRLTDVPALQTIEVPHTESPATECGPEHIFIVLLKTCMDARRHCEERWRGRSPSSIHHSQNNVKIWNTKKMSGEEEVLPTRHRQHCKSSTGHGSVQPGTHWPAAAGQGEWANPVQGSKLSHA